MKDEKLVLVTSNLSITVLPAMGGRISSLRSQKGEEWIAQPHAPLQARKMGDSFIRPEMAGWDEMVPTTDSCLASDGVTQLPDHGEVWSRAWEVDKFSNHEIFLSILLSTRSLKFERKITSTENKINIGYALTNVGTSPMPAFWAAHPLFSAARLESIKIHPQPSFDQTYPDFPLKRLHLLPNTLVHGTSAEYWAAPQEQAEQVQLNAKDGSTLKISWDCAKVPYFGIFVDNGEFSPEPVVSPQPSLAYFVSESKALASNRIPLLQPEEEITWDLALELID